MDNTSGGEEGRGERRLGDGWGCGAVSTHSPGLPYCPPAITMANPIWLDGQGQMGTDGISQSYAVMTVYGSSFRVSIMEISSDCWPSPEARWFSATIWEHGILCSATADTRREALAELRKRLMEIAMAHLLRAASAPTENTA